MYNVLIVDDDTLMRNALRAMIHALKTFRLSGKQQMALKRLPSAASILYILFLWISLCLA